MIEQIANNIYLIEVPMPNNPLRVLNSYFIRGDDSNLLIDTGFKLPECRAALAEGVSKLTHDTDNLDIALTHLHSDHSGLADEFAGEHRYIYINQPDLDFQTRIFSGEIFPKMHRRNAEEGYPENLIKEYECNNPARIGSMQKLDSRFIGLKDEGILTVGEYQLKMISTPGHTPGNAMFWAEKQKIMFTGDHVLFDITPNITASVDVEDSLGDYLESLQKARKYSVEKAFPGHRKPGDYYSRIEELLVHHKQRLEETEKIITNSPGLNGYEITSHMAWRIHTKNWEEFPNNQRWFAVGECEAHLDHLRKQGIIKREMKNGIWRYYAARI